MATAVRVLVALIALEHLWFLVLEMFLWTEPIGLETFGLTREVAEQSATLAANQGLYNGFLAAGLGWSLLLGGAGNPQRLFFLSCVAIAGVFGGMTASPSILYIQAGPALLALGLIQFSKMKRER